MTDPLREALAERLRTQFHCSAETGVFTRLVTRGTTRAGDVAGHVNSFGYRCIQLDGREYRAHRLVWLYVNGTWPNGQLDHINGIKDDNRICNLREATTAQNQQNLRRPRSDNTSGYLGVTWDKRRGKWRAQIGTNGAIRHRGYFTTPEDAHQAYVQAKRELHPFGQL
jgi:hypothetical protein